MNSIRVRTAAALLFLVSLTSLHAQDLGAQLGSSFGFGGSEPPKAKIESMAFERAGYQPGDTVRGVVEIVIEDRWHINSITPTTDFSIPTELRIESSSLTNVETSFPPHIEREFGFAVGEKLAVYEGELTVLFTARYSGGDPSVLATLMFQACDDAVCLAPTETTFTTTVGATVGAIPQQPSASVHSEASSRPSTPSGGFTTLEEGSQAAGFFSGNVGGTLARFGLPLTLAAVFLLGLALNLTPCVYPLIPITLGFFTAQSGARRSTRALLAVTYVLGIALTYSTLGVVSALSGSLFGAWLQSPVVLIGFAIMMIVLATSMFGLWEIRVPSFIADRASGRAGAIGAFTMGLLAGVVAAPCVGPVVISLIALVSERQDPVLGFALFFTLALGLGLPYLILGIFSSGVSQIPRSGPWLVVIKKALGFVLIAMAFYFLRPLLGDEAFRWGAAASLILGGVYLFVSQAGPQGRVIRWGAAVLLLGAGLFFALNAPPSEGIEWEPYRAELLAEARAQGRPVVIDFYADWCLPCKELDHKTFSDPRVIDAAEPFVRLKADLTRVSDPQTTALTKQYSIVGVPTIVFLDGSGEENVSARLSGFENADRFLERIRSVDASAP